MDDHSPPSRPGDTGTPQRPFVTWTQDRPGAAAVLFVVGALAAGMFAVSAVHAIAQGRVSAPLVAITVCWVLGVVVNISGLVRAVRTLRDPQGEAARHEELRVRVLAQPRAQLLRKAALGVTLLSAAPISMGVLFIVAGGDTRDGGWLLVLVGVGFGLFSLVRAWRYPRI